MYGHVLTVDRSNEEYSDIVTVTTGKEQLSAFCSDKQHDRIIAQYSTDQESRYGKDIPRNVLVDFSVSHHVAGDEIPESDEGAVFKKTGWYIDSLSLVIIEKSSLLYDFALNAVGNGLQGKLVAPVAAKAQVITTPL